MLEPSRRVAVNPAHLTDRFQLFVLIVLGESVARLISAAAARPWSVPAGRRAGSGVADPRGALVGLAHHGRPGRPGHPEGDRLVHCPQPAYRHRDRQQQRWPAHRDPGRAGCGTIGVGPRPALYGGVSLFLLASALLPSRGLSRRARWARLVTSLAAMGLVFVGAIVVPVYLVPALTVVLVLGLAAEARKPRRRGARLRRLRQAGPPPWSRLSDVDLACRAFDWIASVAVAADGGLGWTEDGVLFDDLYSGTAGVLLGCAEAEAAGLGTAHVAAGAAAGCWPWPGRARAWPPCPTTACSPGGLASRWRCAPGRTRPGDPAAAEAAAQVTRQIAGRVTQAPPDPLRYTDMISGDAGLLLALIADDSDVVGPGRADPGRPAGGRRGTVPGRVALADGSGLGAHHAGVLPRHRRGRLRPGRGRPRPAPRRPGGRRRPGRRGDPRRRGPARRLGGAAADPPTAGPPGRQCTAGVTARRARRGYS